MPDRPVPAALAARRAVVALAALVASALVSASVAPSALASFLDPATATGTFTADTLAPPANLSAGVCLVGSVTLTWSATPSTWADGYEVRWGTTSGGPYPNSATAVTTSHTVTGLALLTRHYFVVRAYDGNWRSSFTSQVSALC